MKKTSTQLFKKIILALFICANYSVVSQVAAYISPTGTLITGPVPGPVSSGTICAGVYTYTNASTAAVNYTWFATPATSVTISNAFAVSPTFTFSGTGTYTISLIASSGTTSASFTGQVIKVIAKPSTTLSASSPSVCSGSPTTLSVAPVLANYLWSNSATTQTTSVSPLITSVYSFTTTIGGITGFPACASTNSITINVTANPTISVVTPSAACSGQITTLLASGATTYTWNTGATTPFIIVTPTTTTNYTVSGFTGSCSSTKTITLNVTLPPTPANAGASQTVCANSATLNGNTPSVGVGQWSLVLGSGSITSPTSPTTGLTGLGTGPSVWMWQISNGSCPASTATVSVFANASPIMFAFSSSSLICAGQTAVLSSSSSATSYTWSTGSNSTSISVSPTVTTTYTLSGTNAAGCVASTTVMQNVSACTGIAQANGVNNSVAVYPNPTNGELTIALQNIENVFVEVYNGIGQLITKQMIKENEFKINLTEQPVGIYHIRLTKGAEQIYQAKVVKN